MSSNGTIWEGLGGVVSLEVVCRCGCPWNFKITHQAVFLSPSLPLVYQMPALSTSEARELIWWVVKSIYCSCRRLEFDFQHPHDISKSVILTTEELMSFLVSVDTAHMWYIDLQES